MKLIACAGNWQQGVDGSVICTGTVHAVTRPGIPEIDPAQAADFVVAVGLLWAVAWVIVQLVKLIKSS